MMANAVITSQATRIKIIYNDAQELEIEDYIYRDQVTRIRLFIDNDGVQKVRVHLSDGQYINAHFSSVDSIKALADQSPVSIPDNATLLSKLLEIKDE